MSEETLIVATEPHLGAEQPNVLRVTPGPAPLVVQFHNGLQVYVVGDKCSVVSFDEVRGVSVVASKTTRLGAIAAGIALFSLGYFCAKYVN